jgi:hypothetical protein
MRSALIVCQVAFSFMLLIGAGLMMRSLIKMQQMDAGIVPQHVLAMRIAFNWSKYTAADKTRVVIQKLLNRVKSEPGVLSAAISSRYPFEPETIRGGPNLSPSHSKSTDGNWKPARPHPSVPTRLFLPTTSRPWAFR